MKINLKYISKRFVALALAGSLALASTGCGQTKKQQSSENTTTEIATTEAMIDNNQEYYNQIENIETDVVNFINDGMAKGLFDFEVDESMKESIAKSYLNYYLMMNREELSGKSFEIMNQDRDMNAIDMINDSMVAEQAIQEQSIISESGIELNYENIIKNENDLAIIQKMAGIVASMHTAIENKDEAKLNSLKQEVVEIKEGLITDNTEYNFTYSPMTIDLVMILIDAADSLTNGEIITNEEDAAQLYNTSFVKCLDGEFVSNMTEQRVIVMAAELGISGYENMTKEEILEAISNQNTNSISSVSLRSQMRTISKAAMNETLTNTISNETYLDEYSYNNVIENIASRIDLTLHVRPEQSSIDFENANPYGPNNYKGGDQTGKKTTKTVDAKDVPDKEKEEDKTSYTDENGEEIEGLTEAEIIEANNMGDAQAVADHKRGYRNPNPSVAGKSAEWNSIYANSYNTTYNGLVKAEEDAKKNEEVTTEYIDVDDTVVEETTEVTTTEQTTTQTPATEAPTTEVEYIPVPDGEEEEIIIEEGILSSSLKAYKEQILAAYSEAYTNAYEEESVKRI